MYYKIELFSGCYCNEIDGIQTYGPEIYYSGIIYTSEDTSWHTFIDAKNGGIERLEQKLKELSDQNNVSREIARTTKMLEHLKELDELKFKNNLYNKQAEISDGTFYEKTIFAVIWILLNASTDIK